MKRTKIICTLGPASNTEEVIEGLFRAGMNVGRLNFSHGTHESHKATIELFRRVRDRLDVPGAVLLDTKGPEVRLGEFEGGGCDLAEGQEFVLYGGDAAATRKGTAEGASVTYSRLAEFAEPGQTVLLDDGMLTLTVKEVRGSDVVCWVVEGGHISDHKGVTLKNVDLEMTFLSERDKSDILFGIENDIDYIAASFVRTRDDAAELRSFLNKNGGKAIKIIAKIENPSGVRNFMEILEVADGIMVARGDLGVEIDYEKLPGIQKRIILECYRRGKISVTATQMLESMIENPTPTRAEITDIANAVFDGTSAVMLSGESAAGKYPVRAVAAMAKIAVQAEEDAFLAEAYHHRLIKEGTTETSAIAHAACTTARDLKAKCILAITTSGTTARRVSKYRPLETIVACTPDPKTYHQMSLVWGVVPVKTELYDTFTELFTASLDAVVHHGLAKAGDKVVATAGVPLKEAGNTNLIRVETVK